MIVKFREKEEKQQKLELIKFWNGKNFQTEQAVKDKRNCKKHMSSIDDIAQKFQHLNIDQKQIVTKLIEELSAKPYNNSPSTTNLHHTGINRSIEHDNKFISASGKTLATGDTVQILTNGRTGKTGDSATIQRLNKKYVAVKLHRNSSTTHRAAKNLEVITSTK